MNNYHFSSSKYPIIISVLVLILFELFFIWMYQQYAINYPKVDISTSLTLILGRLLFILFIAFLFAQACVNAYNISKLDPKAELEINNEKRYILYKNEVKGEVKQAIANYDDIYLLKYNKAKFINLSYYEILYNENDVKKKIVVSIALTTNLEKKIDKTIELIKEEKAFFDEFPLTIY